MEPPEDNSNSGHNLLPIGQFSILSGLSRNALRLYDALGFLQPTEVDRWTGYRSYSDALLARARLINLMRGMDMPLATIRQVLAAAEVEDAEMGAPAQTETLVRTYLQGLEEQLGRARALSEELLQLRRLRKKARTMQTALEVQVRNEGAQPAISITRHVKVYALDSTIGECLDKLRAYAPRISATASEEAAPFGMYHGPINNEEDGPMEVCLPVSRALEGEGEIEAREFPATRLASVHLRGGECDFPAILRGYDACYEWIAGNGYTTDGPPREIGHTAPGADTEAHMEVAWPFKERDVLCLR